MKFNLATKITLARIALLPVIAFFYIAAVSFDNYFFNDYGKLIALGFFIIAAATDYLDGRVARTIDPKTGKNTVTGLGNLLDTVADKLLIMLGLILLVADPIWQVATWQVGGFTGLVFPYWFAVLAVFIMIGRDFIITLIKSLSKELVGKDLLADKLGKFKFVLQIIAISLFMFFAFNWNPQVFLIEDGTVWYNVFAFTCVFVMAAAVVISVMSCVNYIYDFVSKLKTKETTKENENDDRNNEK